MVAFALAGMDPPTDLVVPTIFLLPSTIVHPVVDMPTVLRQVPHGEGAGGDRPR